MDKSKTTQTQKMVLFSAYCNGRKVQVFVKGEVDLQTGKTSVSTNTYERVLRAINAERGQTITLG